jgi:hypothetical protein
MCFRVNLFHELIELKLKLGQTAEAGAALAAHLKSRRRDYDHVTSLIADVRSCLLMARVYEGASP